MAEYSQVIGHWTGRENRRQGKWYKWVGQSGHGLLTAHRKAVRFIYGLSEGCMVHPRPVRRPYGPFTARQKAVRFILWTVSRTHGKLEVPFRRQSRRYLRRDFLYISFVFYGSVEATTEAIYRWFYFLSTASVWLQHLVYERVFTRSVHQPLVYAFGTLSACLRV